MQNLPESLLPLAKLLSQVPTTQDLTEALLRIVRHQNAQLSQLEQRVSQLEQNLVQQVQRDQRLAERLTRQDARLDAIEALARALQQVSVR